MNAGYAEEVAARVIEQLERGTAPWLKPWKPGELSLPYNAVTGKEYRGMNSMWLAMQDRADPRWMTYNQASSQGAKIKKGSKGTKIIYWKFREERREQDADGNSVFDENGKAKMVSVELERPRAFHAVVFNGEQIDGLPPLSPKFNTSEPERHARAERILSGSGASIRHVSGNRAYYNPGSDVITLPERGQFPTSDNYYATAFHELGHWTGHDSRLNRDLANPFGSEAYAREELRAEIASLMVGERLEIGHDPGQHAAYVKSWIKALEEDPREIFRAAADAEHISTFVMDIEKEVENVLTTQEEAGSVVTQEAASLLQEFHNDAVPGYSPLESWLMMQAEAAKNGYVAHIDTRKTDDIEVGNFTISYATQEGEFTGIETQLYGDGKMFTSGAEGNRISLHISNDDESQPGYLRQAFQSYEYADIERNEYKVQERRLVPENSELHAGETCTFVELADGRMGYAFGPNAESSEKSAVKEAQGHELPHQINEPQISKFLYDLERKGRNYLAVPYADRHLAKQAATAVGYKIEWDREEKAWYAPEGADLSSMSKWTKTVGPDDPKPQAQPSPTQAEPERVYLAVPYAEKEQAKQTAKDAGISIKWDKSEKSWYVQQGVDLSSMTKWTNAEKKEAESKVAYTPPQNPEAGRVYLAIPYAEKEQAKRAAKALGISIKWDKENKSWYAPADADLSSMRKWHVETDRIIKSSARLSPEAQFADALRDAGLKLDGPPIMDGKMHRTPVTGDKQNQAGGVYAGHLEGFLPGGYIKNYRTGEVVNWKADSPVEKITPEERAQLAEETKLRHLEREAKILATYEATATVAQALWKEAPAASAGNAYCRIKGIADPGAAGLKIVPNSVSPQAAALGIMIAKTPGEIKAMREANSTARVFLAGDLLIPCTDGQGKLWSLQAVNPHFKSFMKDGRKSGLATVAGINTIQPNDNQSLVIAEGYATADAVAKLTGLPVVVAFDSGNLDSVACALREKYPNRLIFIAADNDHNALKKALPNVGLVKAQEVALKIGAGVAAPQFREGDKGSDWNDVLASQGEAAARKMMEEQMSAAKYDATINAEKLRTLARTRGMEARNDPTTSADDRHIAEELSKSVEMLIKAGEKKDTINQIAGVGSTLGPQASMSTESGLERINDELAEANKKGRQEEVTRKIEDKPGSTQIVKSKHIGREIDVDI